LRNALPVRAKLLCKSLEGELLCSDIALVENGGNEKMNIEERKHSESESIDREPIEKSKKSELILEDEYANFPRHSKTDLDAVEAQEIVELKEGRLAEREHQTFFEEDFPKAFQPSNEGNFLTINIFKHTLESVPRIDIEGFQIFHCQNGGNKRLPILTCLFTRKNNRKNTPIEPAQ
jgi:hypothetical protein